ncbi:MAG: ABC transporter ATP-binding protein [Bacteroidetes bacterium]|nr:ABC transporter ATP-binding protein [Bacteroidota bacterium]
MHALTVNQVSFSYRDAIPTLRDVSFHVEKGEFLSVAGPNGSGKSTLLRLLDRIYVPRSGTILLDNKNLTEYPRSELARRIAFVPQDTSVQFPFTVLELVLMGRSPHSRGAMFESEHDRAVALEMLERTDTKHLAHHPVTILSGGERQRVVIARALAQQPEILLLDEPNAHLDIAHQLEIFTIIKKLNEESGLTVISVSHDLNLAGAYSDRIGMLVCGSLAALGTPGDVLTEANIRSVFQTNVLVDRHPATRSPRVTLLTSH